MAIQISNYTYDIDTEEVERGREALYSIYCFKKIIKSLGDDVIKYMNDTYHSLPMVRDWDGESYNCYEIAPLVECFLELIFQGDYDYEMLSIDEGEEFYEKLYYDFRVPPHYRNKYNEDYFDHMGQSYVLLKIKSKAVIEALKIASGNLTILNKILRLARRVELDSGDIVDFSTVNLEEFQVEILLGYFSFWELDQSWANLLELEEYCRKVVSEYGKN